MSNLIDDLISSLNDPNNNNKINYLNVQAPMVRYSKLPFRETREQIKIVQKTELTLPYNLQKSTVLDSIVPCCISPTFLNKSISGLVICAKTETIKKALENCNNTAYTYSCEIV